MKVKSVTQSADGKIHVTLENKLGVSFNNITEVRQVARDAITKLGNESRVAIAILRAARLNDIVGQELQDILRQDIP